MSSINIQVNIYLDSKKIKMKRIGEAIRMICVMMRTKY